MYGSLSGSDQGEILTGQQTKEILNGQFMNIQYSCQ